jgi:hypothetical protein
MAMVVQGWSRHKAPKTSKTGTNTMVNMIQKYAGREGKQIVTH